MLYNTQKISAFLLLLLLVSYAALYAGNLDNYQNRDNWKLIAGKGAWQKDISGDTCLTVTGGEKIGNSNYWTFHYPFQPNTLYKLTCQARKSPGTSGGRMLIGSNIVNKDIDAVTDWTDYKLYFKTPSKLTNNYLRFGQWHVNGTIWFRNINLIPVRPVFMEQQGMQLGYGELVEGDKYTDIQVFSNKSTHFAKSLNDFNCYFNTNRWDFRLANYVIYKHTPGNNVSQTNATLTVNVSYYEAGSCEIHISRDKQNWQHLKSINKPGRYTLQVPDNIFPASTVYVRFNSFGINPRFQINNYTWQATLNKQYPKTNGNTIFIDKPVESDRFTCKFLMAPSTSQPLQMALSNPSNTPVTLKLYDKTDNVPLSGPIALAPGEGQTITLPDRILKDKRQIEIKQGQTGPASLYQINLSKTILDRTDFGYLISDQAPSHSLWWCESTHKVGKTRPAPAESGPRIRLFAAKNEYEAFQFVIRANQKLKNVIINMSDMVSTKGHRISRSLIRIMNVEYVTITTPTDALGSIGEWPDPLPPLSKTFAVNAGENQPVWIQIKIPESAIAGDYYGAVSVRINGKTQKIPVILHVWDFTLPHETHLQTAMSMYSSNIIQYHHFNNNDNITIVLEKYFKNMQEHRISPYDPFVLGNIGVEFDLQSKSARVDFGKFDALARKYLDEWKFNSFRLILEGIGKNHIMANGANGQVAVKSGSMEYEILMTDYLLQVQNHLEKMNWLDKAYIYWTDEPDPEDYPLIRKVNSFIKKAAPKLTRMLTEEPVPELYDDVDLWCPKLDNYVPEIIEQRRRAGDRIWWYICTGPKEPFPGLFIDHHAVELRTWIWQSWQQKLDGILIWTVNYWNSENTFIPPDKQNPYHDPMSYVRGNNLKPGEIAFWGNGDGRFIYPPQNVFKSTAKNYEAPVNSIRWEILRDGLEDYEYFWLLRELINKKKPQYADQALLRQAKSLLNVPDAVTSSLTNFSTLPGPIYEHRKKIAEMIEKLGQEL